MSQLILLLEESVGPTTGLEEYFDIQASQGNAALIQRVIDDLLEYRAQDGASGEEMCIVRTFLETRFGIHYKDFSHHLASLLEWGGPVAFEGKRYYDRDYAPQSV